MRHSRSAGIAGIGQNEHRTRLADIWNAYIDTHPYDFVLSGEGDGVYVLRVLQESPTPPDFSIAMGEWLYNLRSALDYTIWATAVYVSGSRPPPHEGVLQYPIYDDPKAWERNLYRLKGLHPHHREMLNAVQPFHRDPDANFLGWINRLARIDRHRRLVDGTAYLAVIEPVFRVPEGCTVEMEWGERVLVDGWADVARVTVQPWRDGFDIAVNPRVGIDPEVREWAESPFGGAQPFNERMRIMQVFVAGEMAAYEYDCTGQGRQADMLTAAWKAESDARRVKVPIKSDERHTVNWSSAGPAREGTESRFQGEDFPHGPAPVEEWEDDGDLDT